MDAIFLIVGLALLLLGGDFLLRAAVAAAARWQVPKVVVGMTIVSFATSLPELITGIRAALAGYPDLSLGNVIGSNIANLGFVLGLVLLFSKMDIQKSFYKFDWPIVFGVSLLLLFFIYDGTISQTEGVLLLCGLVGVMYYLIRYQPPVVAEHAAEVVATKSWWWIIAFVALGSLGLAFGSQWLVKGAVGLARAFDVSERIIGITLVSIGTSLPELVASGMAIVKNAWTPDNPTGTWTGFSGGGPSGDVGSAAYDVFIEDGSFFRIANMTLGYKLPKNILKQIRMSSLRLYVSVDNVHIWTKYSGWDPDVSVGNNQLTPGLDADAYPRARTFRTGIVARF